MTIKALEKIVARKIFGPQRGSNIRKEKNAQ
jgi:hypothetical protein